MTISRVFFEKPYVCLPWALTTEVTVCTCRFSFWQISHCWDALTQTIPYGIVIVSVLWMYIQQYVKAYKPLYRPFWYIIKFSTFFPKEKNDYTMTLKITINMAGKSYKEEYIWICSSIFYKSHLLRGFYLFVIVTCNLGDSWILTWDSLTWWARRDPKTFEDVQNCARPCSEFTALSQPCYFKNIYSKTCWKKNIYSEGDIHKWLEIR